MLAPNYWLAYVIKLLDKHILLQIHALITERHEKMAVINHLMETFSLGVGIQNKMRKRQPLPPGLMKPKKIPQRKGARKVRRPSAYEQTQKLMSELSWPTY